MCIITGEEARRVERLDTEIVKVEIQELLTKNFQDRLKKWKVKV